MSYVVKHKKPCNDCPWRREHAAGWLGGYTPEWFTERVNGEVAINCHKTLPFDDEKVEEIAARGGEQAVRETFPLCAGSLIVQRNMCKVPRDPDLAAAVRKVERDPTVFNHPVEFLHHHAD